MINSNKETELKIGDKLKLLLDYRTPIKSTCIAGRISVHKQATYLCELIDESIGLGGVHMFLVKPISEDNPLIKKEFWAPANKIIERIKEE